MLGIWRSHSDYQNSLKAGLSSLARFAPFAVWERETELSMMYILNLDPLKHIVSPLYSPIGRPSERQPEIFRSLVLMNRLGYSLDEWVFSILPKSPILCLICGFMDKLPRIASYYDFINRIIKLDERPCHKRKKRKPAKKYGNKKLPSKHPNVVARFVEKILAGQRFNNRPERVLQQIFAETAVKPSFNLGLIPQNVSISGDGTCVKTGASPYGVKTCECKDFQCDCTRRFSDPNADWGWDSHNKQPFYGYTGYFISTYNKAEKLDLPLYLRIVDAKRHDSVSAVVALAEFRDLYPYLNIDTFISDSASDNYATYELLYAWNINAVIALNSKSKGHFKYPKHLSVDEDGTPICPGGNRMICRSFCGKDRCRIKYRCPRVCGKPYENCVSCSPSKYGRVIYTKPTWDLRLFTAIPRGSERFKLKMNERTAAERINNRILHHYGIENSKNRGKKRISFFVTIAAINVHLDAQLAKMKATGTFNFAGIFALRKAA